MQESYIQIYYKKWRVLFRRYEEKDIYLTFDNGYENGYTGKILDVLKEKKVPATFFVTGHYIKTQKDLLLRMKDEGHIIGNHSWSHPDFTAVNDEKLRQELTSVTEEIKKVTGQKEVKYVRPRAAYLVKER